MSEPLSAAQVVPFLRSCIASAERITDADVDAIDRALGRPPVDPLREAAQKAVELMDLARGFVKWGEWEPAVVALRAALASPAVPRPEGLPYEDRVQAMADALHEDCRLEWQAAAVVDPTRQITQHGADAHYGRAHHLVRRLSDTGDTPKEPK